MKDLQLAFFKSQVPHSTRRRTTRFFAAIYNFAAKNDFKYILTGGNYSTECVRESIEWTLLRIRHAAQCETSTASSAPGR